MLRRCCAQSPVYTRTADFACDSYEGACVRAAAEKTALTVPDYAYASPQPRGAHLSQRRQHSRPASSHA
eukprot:6204606-Pleurochrysis_carterae.AAC.2